MKLINTFSAFAIFCIATSVCAGGTSTHIPMTPKGSKTFYVSAWIAGIEPTELMVDTGSSYLTINQVTLNKLKTEGKADYLRDLISVLANGDELMMPVYRIPNIVLGNSCELFAVEAVVFPGKTRQILGLSVLRKASPFMFSVAPLSCNSVTAANSLVRIASSLPGPARKESLPADPRGRLNLR